METITAIVHIPHEMDSEESKKSHSALIISPFHAFMNALLGSEPPKTTSMSGAAEWSGAPMEALVAQGLWPIMLRIASKLDIELSVEKDVLLTLAPKTEYLLNIGITLRYSSPAKAAEDFRKILANANNDGFSGGAKSFSAIFQSQSAAFFAEILKNLQATRGVLKAEAEALHSRNRITKKIIYLPENTHFMGLVSLSGLIRLYHMMSYDYRLNCLEERDVDYLRQLGDAFMVYREALNAAHLLPHRMADFAKVDLKMRLTGDPYVIIEQWLRSAILLSAADAPAEQGSVGSEDLLQMLVRARETEDQALMAKTYARFAKRGSKPVDWPAIQADFIATWIYEGIKCIRSESHEWLMNQCLVHYDFSRPIFATKKISPENALAYATLSSPEISKILEKDKKLETAIANALPWDKITLINFKNILEYRNLSAESIAIGITKLDKTIQQQAISEWLIDCNTDRLRYFLVTPEAVDILRQAGLLPEDFLANLKPEEILLKNPSADQLEQALLEVCVENPGDDQLDHTLNLMSAAEEETINRVIAESKHRKQILDMIQEHYFDSKMLTHFGGSEKAFKQFWKKLQLPLFLRICLALEIRTRNLEYSLPKKELLEAPAQDISLPWSQFWQVAEKNTGVYFPIQVDALQVKSLMQEQAFSEESIFCWAFEGDPKVKSKLAAYLRARDRYYQIVNKK